MMQYEVYGRPSRSRRGGGGGDGRRGDTLPVRRRAGGHGGGHGGGDGGGSRGDASSAKLGTSGLGGGVLDEPSPPRCRLGATGANTAMLLVLLVGVVALALQQGRHTAAMDDLEARVEGHIERLQQAHDRKLAAVLGRLDDAEQAARQAEREMIDLSRQEADQEAQLGLMEKHFMNLNSAVVELMQQQHRSSDDAAAEPAAAAAVAAAAAAGAAAAASAGRSAAVPSPSSSTGALNGSNDDGNQWTKRIIALERNTVKLKQDVVALAARAGDGGLLDEQLEEVQKSVAGLQVQVELKLGEEMEALVEGVKEAEHRLHVLEDDCADDPCGTHGTCTELPRGFACNCELGWEGSLCDRMSAMEEGSSLEGLSSLLHD